MPFAEEDNLRIALVNSADRAGGAESVARLLRDGLHRAGQRADLWVGRVWDERNAHDVRLIPRSEEEQARAVRFARYGFFNLGLGSAHRFCDSTNLDAVDVVHLHNVHGHYFCLTALPRLAARAPLVWTFHDFFPITGGCAFPFRCERWLTQCGSCPQLGRYPLVTPFDHTRRLQALKRRVFQDLPVTIVTPSRHLAEAVQRSGVFAAAEVLTIPYGVDTRLFHPHRAEARRALQLSADRPVVLLTAQGLDDPRKGAEYALAALRQVEVPGLVVLLAGGGDQRPLAEALARHEVRPLGYLTEPAQLADCYAAADLVLCTSLAENLPCVVLEAQASGTAVLAFDIPGVDEEIVSGETGYLVPAGDAVALAQGAEKVLRHRAQTANVGAAARAQIEISFSTDLFIDRHLQLYRSVCRRSRRFCNTC